MSVDIPISSSRLLHLQRGDRGQKTPSPLFGMKCGYICVGRKWSDLIKLALRLENEIVFIHQFQEQWTEIHKSILVVKNQVNMLKVVKVVGQTI